MPAKAKSRRTPSEVMCRILQAAMAANDVTAQELADSSGVHQNTVKSDLRDPDKIKLQRLWLYFLALGVPIDDALAAFAESFARGLTQR